MDLVMKVLVLFIIFIQSSKVFAQDAEWFNVACATRAPKDDFPMDISFNDISSLIPSTFLGNKLLVCKLAVSAAKANSVYDTLSEEGELFYRTQGAETVCTYKVKKKYYVNDKVYVDYLDLVFSDMESGFTESLKQDYLNYLFKYAAELFDAVEINCTDDFLASKISSRGFEG